jgi:hypothetical protein
MKRFTALACLAWVSAATAEEVSLSPIKDNTIYQDDEGRFSNGMGHHLFAGTNSIGQARRALLAFDVAGAIPAGSVIDGATLTLNMSRTNTGPAQVSLHRLLNDWGEGDSDAPGEEGGGAAAAHGDATWLHRFFDHASWDARGGDFDPSASAGLLVGGVGAYSWNSIALGADVQGWLDAPLTNFGWMLVGAEGDVSSSKRFDSGDHLDSLVHPQLTVQYTVPEPGVLVLVAAGWAVGCRVRWNTARARRS